MIKFMNMKIKILQSSISWNLEVSFSSSGRSECVDNSLVIQHLGWEKSSCLYGIRALIYWPFWVTNVYRKLCKLVCPCILNISTHLKGSLRELRVRGWITPDDIFHLSHKLLAISQHKQDFKLSQSLLPCMLRDVKHYSDFFTNTAIFSQAISSKYYAGILARYY